MRIGVDASMLGKGGGIATYAAGLIAALGRLDGGHSLVLWCPRRAAAAAARHLAPPGAALRAPGAPGRLLDRWGRLAWANPLSVEALVGPVDVFHGPNYLLPAQRGRAALVITVHDLSALRHPEWHPATRALTHRLALRRTARRADHVITDTEAVRGEVMAALGVPPERVTAVPPAPAPMFRPRDAAALRPALAPWGLTPGGYLLWVGALEPRKNLPGLLNASALLRSRRADAPPLVLAGPPGWRNRKVLSRVAAAAPHVRHLGFVPEDDLPSLVAGCAAFVMPSLYEGFGIPVLEALACGVPVIVSPGGALAEVGGDAVLLADPRDPAAIAAAIGDALEDGALRAALARRGPARAGQFTWDRTARAVFGVYAQAIAARTHP